MESRAGAAGGSDEGALDASGADTYGTPPGGPEGDDDRGQLTHSQRNAIKKIDNVIENNAKPHDFAGVRNEIAGRVTGFDHVTEMRNSVRALESAAKSLEGSLQNPGLGSSARSEISGALARARATINEMRNALGGR
jgi:hypothetical protein